MTPEFGYSPREADFLAVDHQDQDTEAVTTTESIKIPHRNRAVRYNAPLALYLLNHRGETAEHSGEYIEHLTPEFTEFRQRWQEAIADPKLKQELVGLTEKEINDDLLIMLTSERYQRYFTLLKVGEIMGKDRTFTLLRQLLAGKLNFGESDQGQTNALNQLEQTVTAEINAGSTEVEQAALAKALAVAVTDYRGLIKRYQDEMTGVLSQDSFNQYLDFLTDYYRTSENKDKFNYAYVILDLDHFKEINDTYSHQTGDEIIKFFAQALANNPAMKSSDTLFRRGGDEFVIFLPIDQRELPLNDQGKVDNEALLNRVYDYLQPVYQQLRDQAKKDHVYDRINLSAGVAFGSIANIEELRHNADDMLHQAKRRRGRVSVLFSDHVDDDDVAIKSRSFEERAHE